MSRALIELLRGTGAHADPIAYMQDISAELAARQVNGFPHSIRDLVFHMNYWMDYDLRRVAGKRPPYPAHNSESFPSKPAPGDAAEWDGSRKDFAALISQSAALANSSPQELERRIEPTHASHEERAATLEAVLWQLVAHNSYHIGQIAMIRQALGAWPPRGGGDTW
ncbi:MAG TPA: DinB family protein [Candidatus Acidoferrum sp.]|nr:DinB family protein [Candidatus Acidoferrum sp.]